MKNGCNFPTYDEFAVDEELERHDNLQKTGIKKVGINSVCLTKLQCQLIAY